jgi:hypothetical protein
MKLARTAIVLAIWTMLAGQANSQSYKRSFPDVQEGITPAPAMYSYGALSSASTVQLPLPVPVDPNDLLMQDAFDRSDYGSGYAIASETAPNDPWAVFRIVPNINLNVNYDTGVPTAGHSPSSFPLQGSDAARGSGIFSMSSPSAELKTDVQFPAIDSQVLMQIQATQSDQLSFRQAFGRVGNWLGGTYYSSFSDNGTLPQSIIAGSAPAGALPDPKVVQLQYVTLFQSGLLLGAALENPNRTDFTRLSATDAPLQRSPDLVARIRYQPLDAWGSLQGGLLVRQFGYEDATGTEHFTHATVAYSGNARFKTWGNNNVRLGVVTGEGIGNRLFGFNTANIAAGPNAGVLQPIHSVGTFGSYQHFWTDNLWSTVAYGYASADTFPSMTSATMRSQNGWFNLIWNNPTGRIALGVEYQVGQREIGDGRHGLNHGIQFSFQIGKGYITPTVSSAPSAPADDSLPPGALAPSPSTTSGGTIYPRL